MNNTARISLQIPGDNKNFRFFSIKLKKKLQDEYTEYKSPERMFVVSDFYGDFRALRRLLIKSEIIDVKYRWLFDNGHLVILGNAFSYLQHSVECLWLIYSLEEKAQKYGGHVHFILGEHEFKGINGEWKHRQPRYAYGDFFRRQKGTILYDGNAELCRWLRTKNFFERVGSVLLVNAFLFTKMNGIEEFQRLNDVNRRLKIEMCDACQIGVTGELHLEDRRLDQNGLFTCLPVENVNKLLSSVNADTMIIGGIVVDSVGEIVDGTVWGTGVPYVVGYSEGLLIDGVVHYRITSTGLVVKLK